MTTARRFRGTLVACAAQWLVVGLQLADLIRGVENDSVRHVKIVMVVGFGLAGLFSLVQLWTAVPPTRSSEHR